MGSTGRDLHIDIPLSNLAIAYRPENFIADQICPIVPVDKQSNAYYVWDIGDAYRIEDTRRAPGTEANRVTRNISSGTYYALNYALKDHIPYEDLQNADAAQIFLSRQARTEYIKDKLMLDMELRVANKVTSGTNVGSYSNVASAWTDYTNSDPIKNITTAINNVEDATGQRPNRIVFSRYSWRNFRENVGVINRAFGTYASPPAGSDAKIVGVNHAKAIFEVDQVLIGGVYYNSTMEGQTESLSKMWGDKVLVYYAPMTQRIDKPSFMYAFRWKNVTDMQAEVLDDRKRKAESIELGYYQDEKITAKNLGFLISGVGSSQ